MNAATVKGIGGMKVRTHKKRAGMTPEDAKTIDCIAGVFESHNYIHHDNTRWLIAKVRELDEENGRLRKAGVA